MQKARALALGGGLDAGSTRLDGAILVTNVHILPMDVDRIIEDQAVLVRNDLITAIGSVDAIEPPEDALVIDGNGGYLMPGLSDMHAHLSGYNDGEKSSGNAEVVANQLLLYLATGVTLVRDMSGTRSHFDYRKRVNAGELVGPHLFFTSPILEGHNAVWNFSVKVHDPDGAEELVARFAEQGYWGIKVYHTLSAEVFDALMEAADRHGLKVVGHIPFGVGVQRALERGIYSIEHLRGYDFDGLNLQELAENGGRSATRFGALTAMTEERMVELVHLTVLARTWNVPTLAINRFLFDSTVLDSVTGNARFAVVHPAIQDSVANLAELDVMFSPEAKSALRDVLPRQQELVRRLHEAGAGILVGTDAELPGYVPGATPIDEMKQIADAGVPIFEVLQAATLDAAVSLGIDAERGTVCVGKRASLILVEKNPLETLDHLWSLVGVLHQGRWLSFPEMERRLAQLSKNYRTHEK